MRTWTTAAFDSVTAVSDQPMRWLPGALAWVVSVGWIVLVIGVARPPTMAELTFFGARFYTSGAWPWNLVGVIAAIALVAVIGLILSALAEATLIRGRAPSGRDVRRAFAVSLVCLAPVAAALGLVGVGIAAVAPAEVNAPGSEPIARIIMRVLPLLLATLLVIVACGAWHAAALRSALAGESVAASLARAPTALARGGTATLVHLLAAFVLRMLLVAAGVMMLRVLWAPIEQRLALDGVGVAVAFLLLGFVAIWLCIVLLGGALHAWASATWTRILAPGERGMEASSAP